MTQSQQLRKLAAQSATAFLVAALCAFPLYIDKFSNLGVVKFTAVCTLCWAFALWLVALRAVGAVPQPGRLPWRQDTALWALGAVTISGNDRAKIANPARKYGTPSLAGVMAKDASRVATIRSQATTRLQAAPHTVPWTAAITGTGNAGMPAMTSSTGLSHSCGSVCTGTSSRS